MEFKKVQQGLVNHLKQMIAEGMTLVRLENYSKVYIQDENGDPTSAYNHVSTDAYLNAFTDPVERQDHNCNCCKSFIRQHANIAGINKKNQIVSIWDFEAGEYQKAVDALRDAFVGRKIVDYFFTKEATIGTQRNASNKIPGHFWNHFYFDTPESCKLQKHDVRTLDSVLGDLRATVQVFERGLKEITNEAVEMAEMLLDNNELENGAQFKDRFMKFKQMRIDYLRTKPELRANFCWRNATLAVNIEISRLRNTAFGTLLTDLSDETVPFEKALGAWDKMMAPSNYKRTSTPATPKQLAEAKEFLEKGGYMEAIYRQFAELKDVAITDIMWADRSVKKKLQNADPFAILQEKAKPVIGSLDNVKEVGIGEFEKMLIKFSALELMFESKHQGNLFSMIGAKNPESPSMFKWDTDDNTRGRNLSIAFNGNMARQTTTKEKVRAANGNVDGIIRISLAWGDNGTDLDLHCMKNGEHIYYNNKGVTHRSSGMLDVDANGIDGYRKEPVENIAFTDKHRIGNEEYTIQVHNFNSKGDQNQDYSVEIECNGKLYVYNFSGMPRTREFVDILKYRFDGENIKITWENKQAVKGVQGTSQEIWGINTNEFHPCKLVCLSPNYWGEDVSGSKQYLFALEGCVNPESPSGFFNEFLKAEFHKHRRSMEMLGRLMVCEHSEEQISGLGFANDVRASVVVKATEAKTGVEKLYKINF